MDGILCHAMVHFKFCRRLSSLAVSGLFVGQSTLQLFVRPDRERSRRNDDGGILIGDNGNFDKATTEILARILVLPVPILSTLWLVISLYGGAIFHGLSVPFHRQFRSSTHRRHCRARCYATTVDIFLDGTIVGSGFCHSHCDYLVLRFDCCRTKPAKRHSGKVVWTSGDLGRSKRIVRLYGVDWCHARSANNSLDRPRVLYH